MTLTLQSHKRMNGCGIKLDRLKRAAKYVVPLGIAAFSVYHRSNTKQPYDSTYGYQQPFFSHYQTGGGPIFDKVKKAAKYIVPAALIAHGLYSAYQDKANPHSALRPYNSNAFGPAWAKKYPGLLRGRGRRRKTKRRRIGGGGPELKHVIAIGRNSGNIIKIPKTPGPIYKPIGMGFTVMPVQTRKFER